ncbi:MAG: hypothetical protein R3D46_11775 [Defluviimonas denitrificans]
MVTARRLGITETAAALAFWGNLVFLVIALAMTLVFADGQFSDQVHPSLGFLTRGWVAPTPRDLA